MQITWRAFPLHPEVPEDGISLEKHFSAPPETINRMIDRLRETAASLGLPFGDRRRTCNSRLAQELGLWAASQGKGEAFQRLAFSRYFVDGANLARIPVLLDIVRTAGLDKQAAMDVLTTRSFSHLVDRDWELARLKGIDAVPTFVIGTGRLVGAQRYEDLAKMLLASGVSRIP